jgi:phosphatidylglycerophosphatase A
MQSIIKFVTSFLYIGYAPVAPGTFGSIGGLAVYLLVKDSAALYAISFIAIFALGMAFSGEAENLFKRKDAGQIVIDEACGMMLSLAFLPCKLWIIVAGFLLFRLFDIIKPPPIKSLEKLSGSLGIMLDDIIAALYTNIILQIIVKIQKSL